METLEDVKADAKDVLVEMKDIGARGPTKENAESMLEKMGELQKIADRLADVPDEE